VKLEPFVLERYFARHEFTARHLLSCSDCEPLAMTELLGMAGETTGRLWQELKLGYTETQGHPLLRRAVAALYPDRTADEVLVTVPEEGIFLTMHALLEPGDHVVCTRPAYQSLHAVARAIGCEVTAWKPQERQRWWFDPDQLASLVRHGTRLVVLNFPHNPTGSLPSRAEFERMVQTVRRCGAHLFSDEMYRFLELQPGSRLPAGCELYERAVTLGGLSKSFGLPGLRLGWLAGSDRELLARVSALKDYTTICNGAPSEILGLVALENREAIVARQLARLRANLSLLERFLADHPETFEPRPPLGGSVCFPRLLAPEGAERLCRRLVQESGIMLVPSGLFDHGDGHVRMGFGRDSLSQALAALTQALEGR
jgi:aspartate/methionine/tyrosine aminotransferase